MNGEALERMPLLAVGSALAGVMLLAALLGPTADAGAAADQSRAGKAKQRNGKKGKRNVKKPFAKRGPVHACVKVHGRGRGVVRLVRHPRACRRLSGWHRFAWERIGAAGPPGSGLPGAAGAGGDDGSRGAQGADGQDAQIAQLLDRIVGLENEVGILEGTVGALGDDLLSLEGTVDSVCTQVGTLTGQLDDLTTAIAGISLITLLDVALDIPALPVFNEFECL